MCVNLYEKEYVCVRVTAYVQQHFSADVQKQRFYVMIGTLGGWHGEEMDGCGHHQTDSMQYHDCAHLHTHLLYVFVSLSLSLSEYVSALIIHVQTMCVHVSSQIPRHL